MGKGVEILLVTMDWTSAGEESHACRFFPHEVEWWDCRREKESQAGVQISRCTKLLHGMNKVGHSGGNVILPPFRFIGLNLKISSTKVDDEWWN